MPNNGLNLRLVSLAAGLAAVIIIAVAALATHQAEEAALPVSQPEASDLITTPSKSNFGSIVWHKSNIPAPSTPFKNGAGAEVSLLNYKGKVLVVNFWATWCAPCVKEMPTLNNLQARLGGADFEVLAISQDREGARVAVPFMDVNGWNNLARYTESAARFSKDAGLRGLPTSLIIDKAGNEVGRVEGDTDWSSPHIEQSLRDLISES
ncbi:MAG TPA: TlpA family protein disulfide reductase [Rhodospirillaceae bacterium]|nr:TlpA family protein disulfide reductase [Rhodospirillaceae bacterium]